MGSSPGATAAVFSQPNQTLQNYVGNALVLGTGPGTGFPARYDRYTANDLVSMQWSQKVRGTTVYGPATGASSLVIFSQPTNTTPNSYRGPLAQFTNYNTQVEFDFNVPAQFNFTGSMLLIHTHRSTELRFSFRDEFAAQWAAMVGSLLSSQIRTDGGPIFSWDPFPGAEKPTIFDTETYYPYLDPTKIYLTITQNLIASPPLGADYRCSFTYWIEFTYTGGVLGAHVQQAEDWVEGGLFSSLIFEILDPNVKLGVYKLNAALAAAIPKLTSVKDVYYLPGRQVNWVIKPGEQNLFEGDTRDDITVVVEL